MADNILQSDSQQKPSAARLNDGLTEQKVLENFALRKNGLIIEVYYDSRIGIVEVETGEPKARDPKETKMAEGREPFRTESQLSIPEIVAARNQHEAQVGVLLDEFKAKLDEFFAYVRMSPEGQRLIVKMQSHLPEDEIYADFGKIYRKYKAFNRKKVGDYFFAVTEELVEKLCDEFEEAIIRPEVQHDQL